MGALFSIQNVLEKALNSSALLNSSCQVREVSVVWC